MIERSIDKMININNKIAVIGLSCDFPKAVGVENFWRGLCDGYDGISHISEDHASLSGAVLDKNSSVRNVLAKGVLENAECFDADFFHMSPKEAEITDPQQRVFLESCWKALDDAGYAPSGKAQKIGVFGGSNFNSYLLLKAQNEFDLRRDGLPFDFRIGNDKDYLTTRVSYKLNLTGPSMAVQSACSTSLSALHLACRSVLENECEIALAGAVSVKFPLHSGHSYEPGGMYPPDGACRPFDLRGEGPPDGDGVAVVALKRLSDAERDGDNILAVILGTAINNDGSAKVGFTAPGMQGQKNVIKAALAKAGVDPQSVDYIETHGTATPLGDAIELSALAAAYPEKESGYLVGSVKSNIGHLNVASGMAGLVKTILALKFGVIPPTIHHDEANPHLPMREQTFRVPTKVQVWPETDTPKRAAVSSFGIGATNSHVILEAYSEPASDDLDKGPQLVVLSARTQNSLRLMADGLADFVESNDSLRLCDVSYSTQIKRARFPIRLSIAADNLPSLAKRLREKVAVGRNEGTAEGGTEELIFVFPGIGEHYPGMAQGLFEQVPVFRENFQECLEHLEKELAEELLAALFPEGTDVSDTSNPFKAMLAAAKSQQEDPLDRVDLAHVSLFIVEYALARTLESFGVRPTAMIGYSIGEYVAACLSGIMSLADAIKLVTERSRLILGLERGAMYAISASEQTVRDRLPKDVYVSAINGPLLTIVSGKSEAIESFATSLEADGVVSRPLAAGYPFHSDLMMPMVTGLNKLLESVTLNAPENPIISTATGDWMTTEEAINPTYWSQHLSKPVQFSKTLETVATTDGIPRFLQVGPGNGLCNVIRQNLEALATAPLPVLRHRYEAIDDKIMLLSAVGAIWTGGTELDWSSISPKSARRISLPGYQFDRQKYSLPLFDGREAEQESGVRLEADDWGFFPAWKSSRPLAKTITSQKDARVLVFDVADGLSAKAARQMVDDLVDICIVQSGDAFAKTDEGYIANLTEEKAYQSLFSELVNREFFPTHIIIAPNLGQSVATAGSEPDPEQLAQQVKSVVYLLKAHLSTMNNQIDLVLVTWSAQSVLGTESINTSGAALWGLEKTVNLEFSNILCRCIDLPEEYAGLEKALAAVCLDGKESVALRGNYVWQSDLVALPKTDIAPPPQLQKGGTYVIAGGLGHLGLTIAEAIAETGPIRLVLLNRSFATKAELNGSLRHQQSAKRVQAIEDAGAEVVILKSDIENQRELNKAFEGVRGTYGPISGVVNAAGVGGGGHLALRTGSAIDQVLAPKILGTINLDTVTAQDDLDFLLVCSSISSFSGGKGQGDHAAANAFLDAFCHARSNLRSGRSISINWDYWSEAGLGLEAVQASPVLAELQNDAVNASPLLDDVRLGAAGALVFTKRLSVADEWILDEHTVNGRSIFPGTGYLEQTRQAAATINPGRAVDIHDMAFVYPCFVQRDVPRTLELWFSPSKTGYDVRILSLTDVNGRAQETVHCTCSVGYLDELPSTESQMPSGLGEEGGLPTDCPLYFGPRWQNYTQRWFDGPVCVAQLDLPMEFAGDLEDFPMHPALLDIATSFVIQGYGFYMPISYKRLVFFAPFEQQIFATIHSRFEEVSDKEVVTLDVTIRSSNGQELVRIEGITLKRISDVENHMANWTGSIVEQPTPLLPTLVGEGKNDPYLAQRVANGITRREGVRWIRRILSQADTDRLVVSTVSPEDWHVQEVVQKTTDPQIAKCYDRPQLPIAYEEPVSALEQSVAEVFGKVLGLKKVGANDSFFDLGGDSLKGIQLVRDLGENTSLNVSIQDLYNSPTARQLASSLKIAGE